MKEFPGMIIGTSVTVIDFLQLFPAHNRKGLWNATPRSETLFKVKVGVVHHYIVERFIKCQCLFCFCYFGIKYYHLL